MWTIRPFRLTGWTYIWFIFFFFLDLDSDFEGFSRIVGGERPEYSIRASGDDVNESQCCHGTHNSGSQHQRKAGYQSESALHNRSTSGGGRMLLTNLEWAEMWFRSCQRQLEKIREHTSLDGVQ